MNRSLGALVLVALLTVPVSLVSADVITLNLSTDAWQKYSAMGGSAAWSSTADGLKFYGSGTRLVTEVKSIATMDLREATLYMKWMAHGPQGRFSAFGVGLAIEDPYDNASRALYFPAGAGWTWSRYGAGFTTDHSYSGSLVIADDTWYYTRLLINSDASISAVTCTGNYDTLGGTAFYSYDYQLTSDAWNLLSDVSVGAIFNDNYGGTATWMMIGEAAYEVVPEPGAAALFAVGGLLVVGLGPWLRTARRR